ncbi:MAG TPA: hypothetical protein VLV87_07880 [Gammaproteobacteria bacterium]|nr:hypothetical protein [Gammaproteobacteria bacterium]
MNTVIMDVDVHMNCPTCGKAMTKKLRWLEQNPTFKCEGCGKQHEKYGDQLIRVRRELNIADDSERMSKHYKINL